MTIWLIAAYGLVLKTSGRFLTGTLYTYGNIRKS